MAFLKNLGFAEITRLGPQQADVPHGGCRYELQAGYEVVVLDTHMSNSLGDRDVSYDLWLTAKRVEMTVMAAYKHLYLVEVYIDDGCNCLISINTDGMQALEIHVNNPDHRRT